MDNEPDTGRPAPGDGDAEGRQDPIVERRRPQPSEPAVRGLTLKGFLGDSDRRGCRRLYFTRNLDYYAEFSIEDVVDTARIPEDRLPFLGEPASEVTLKAGAKFEYTRSIPARIPDEFDLDVRRVHAVRPVRPAHPARGARRSRNRTDMAADTEYTCGGNTCEGTCGEYTCATHCNEVTCWDETCDESGTCATRCDTCETCPGESVTCPSTGDCTPSLGWTIPDPCPGPSDIETVCETCNITCRC
jgi:hypothetical protein